MTHVWRVITAFLCNLPMPLSMPSPVQLATTALKALAWIGRAVLLGHTVTRKGWREPISANHASVELTAVDNTIRTTLDSAMLVYIPLAVVHPEYGVKLHGFVSLF